jgi:hypothetical protein
MCSEEQTGALGADEFGFVEDFDAGHTRHSLVGEDNGDLGRGPKELQGLGAALPGDDLIVESQEVVDGEEDLPFVVDHQQLGTRLGALHSCGSLVT